MNILTTKIAGIWPEINFGTTCEKYHYKRSSFREKDKISLIHLFDNADILSVQINSKQGHLKETLVFAKGAGVTILL